MKHELEDAKEMEGGIAIGYRESDSVVAIDYQDEKDVWMLLAKNGALRHNMPLSATSLAVNEEWPRVRTTIPVIWESACSGS